MKQECKVCGGDCDYPGVPLCLTCQSTREELNNVVKQQDEETRDPTEIVLNEDADHGSQETGRT